MKKNHWNLIEEYEGEGSHAPTRSYYHGKTMDNPVALKTNEAIYFYHKDQQGSITAISNQNKEIIEKYSYDEYGDLKNNPPNKLPLPRGEGAGGRVNNPLTYTAQYKDEETDLYYYKNRYYSARLGRFLTKDPLGLINGPNTYAYVNNNPINWVDPMGTFIMSGSFADSPHQYGDDEFWSTPGINPDDYQSSLGNESIGGQSAGTYNLSPLASGNGPPVWLEVASREIGENEILGQNDNSRIVEYHSTTTLNAQDDETAWCSSFVNWTMEQSPLFQDSCRFKKST